MSGKTVESVNFVHRSPQDLPAFSTGRRIGSYQRICQCGKSFFSARSFVQWCSNECRKRHYGDRRRYYAGDRNLLRKVKNQTLGTHSKWEWITKLKSMRFACFWCGKFMKRIESTKDHIIPISRGGSDDISNIVPSCMPCNRRKSTMTGEEYLAFLRQQQ
jgi:5-methylcytosine-specific restriction endonuclease McrA